MASASVLNIENETNAEFTGNRVALGSEDKSDKTLVQYKPREVAYSTTKSTIMKTNQVHPHPVTEEDVAGDPSYFAYLNNDDGSHQQLQPRSRKSKKEEEDELRANQLDELLSEMNRIEIKNEAPAKVVNPLKLEPMSGMKKDKSIENEL